MGRKGVNESWPGFGSTSHCPPTEMTPALCPYPDPLVILSGKGEPAGGPALEETRNLHQGRFDDMPDIIF